MHGDVFHVAMHFNKRTVYGSKMKEELTWQDKFMQTMLMQMERYLKQ